MKISIVINSDTRTGFEYDISNAESTFNGCVSVDFILYNIENKRKFFEGFDVEIIMFIDEHIKIPAYVLEQINGIPDVLVIRKHTNETNFNDWNYIKALQLATGDYIAHFDQDTAAFTSTPKVIEGMINLLEQVDYVSYPSYWSPYPVHDDSFDHVWASTRMFMCKRETLDFPEIIKCQNDYDYWCSTYPVNRKCHWLEHILGSISKYKGKGVFYPPMELDLYTIFSWGSYRKGTLQKLNNMSYEDVIKHIKAWGGISYPCDTNAGEIN